MKKFNKKKLPSRHTTIGADIAPQRSLYYAMDLTEKDVAKPFVGVVSTWNEAAPCNINLMKQAQFVKKGVHSSGGTPREFCTITVTDGIAMGHEGMKSSLISRDVIADSTELTVRCHCYDALVGLAGCDKSLPGLMMSMVRLNIPSVFIYGGSILPGRFNGKDVTVVDVFEGVGKYTSNKMTAHALRKLELNGFINLYGVDNSRSMLDYCHTKATLYHSNILQERQYKAIIMNWTLHFIKQKFEYLEHCSKNLQEDGFIILSDKTNKDSFLIERYHDFKRDCGVSEEEIIGKQQAVEDMMYIDDINWYFDQGKKLGFNVDIIDADFCFTTFLYRKTKHE